MGEVPLQVPAFEERHGWRGFMIAPTHIIRGIGLSTYPPALSTSPMLTFALPCQF